MCYSLSDLGYSSGLFRTGGADFPHETGNTLNCRNHFYHRRASPVYKRCALIDTLYARRYKGFDLFCGVRRSTGETSNFGGDYGKSTSLFAGSSGFDSSVQCQDVGLKGYSINNTNNVNNLS